MSEAKGETVSDLQLDNPDGNFALGFYYRVEDGFDADELRIESRTDNFDHIIEDLFDARNAAAEGAEHWEGARLMILVRRDGAVSWEELNDGSRVE